ncbi:hypothetical protein BaRGS_00004052 [Batillaria attramentaria]|uniref:15-hydroxyprostaglandin dehydrogenase [NAD(+)] n=1 Tax=Batillaria attramentaria TaxID=370345 RepID=A0ABD0LYL5_9CAEN
MNVAGKAALVTGGAQGLGKAFSKILLQNGAKVLFTDIKEDVGHATLSEFQKDYGQNNVVFIKADVTSQPQMEESFQLAKSSFGRLDIVVNNAGVGGEHDDNWERCKGPIRCTRLALNYLRRDKGGQGGVIVNISSAGGLKPTQYGPVYSGTKAGLLMYSRSLAANSDLQQSGVRVNTLCPSFADTSLVASIRDNETTVLNNEKAWEQVQSVGIMPVEYVAEGLFELVTDESKNGAVLLMAKATGKKYLEM